MSKDINFEIIIHHYPCADGELSAAIYHINTQLNHIFIPWKHELKEKNIDVIKDKIELHSDKVIQIIFLDYCPDFVLISQINKLVDNVTILDHHKAACDKFIKELKDSDLDNVKITFDNEKSGCQLTWEYFKNNDDYPLSVKHIGNRDIWKWDDINTEPFTCAYPLQYGLNSEQSPEERLLVYCQILECDNLMFNKIVAKGKESIIKMKKECLEILPNATLTVDNDKNGKELSIVEVPMTKYHLTKYIQELVSDEYPEYQVLRLVYQKPEMKVYSLRSLHEDAHVDLLAQKYGGNGHKAASGYSLKST